MCVCVSVYLCVCIYWNSPLIFIFVHSPLFIVIKHVQMHLGSLWMWFLHLHALERPANTDRCVWVLCGCCFFISVQWNSPQILIERLGSAWMLFLHQHTLELPADTHFCAQPLVIVTVHVQMRLGSLWMWYLHLHALELPAHTDDQVLSTYLFCCQVWWISPKSNSLHR